MPMKSKRTPPKVTCPYCGSAAKLVDSSTVYHGRSYGMIWDCRPCDAYVGVHEISPRHAPKGRLANAELRRWKIEAHNAFDPIWKGNRLTRGDAYRWMQKAMNITRAEAHIGKLDVADCRELVRLVERDYGNALQAG